MWITNRNLILLIIHSLITTCLCDVSHILNNQHNHNYQNEHRSSRIEDDHHNHYHGQDGKYNPNDDGTGWDIRLSVPGEPDLDYPILNAIPRTSFNCIGKKQGYYADTQTRCQVFKVCTNTATSGFFSFLCPNGTLFDQRYSVCNWWMNVRCVDTEKYSNFNDGLSLKSGQAMMADIKTMIMYPMHNPYSGIPPQMKKVIQVYNPPGDMISELQQKINSQYSTTLNENVNYSTFYGKSTKADSHSSGSSTIAGNYQGVVPSNHNPVYKENIENSFFTRENFGGLSLKKSFDANTEQAIKITKQQFTYPSRFDKQYTVTVPKAPTVQPLIVHVPINIPAIDQTFNTVSENKKNDLQSSKASNSHHFNESIKTSHIPNSSKPIPLIVLLLQPPLETPNFNYRKEITHNNLINSMLASKSKNLNDSFPLNSNIKSIINSSTVTNSANMEHLLKNLYHSNDYKSIVTENMRKASNNGTQFTTNVASQTNFYIMNNLGKKQIKPAVGKDVENLQKMFGNNEYSIQTDTDIQRKNLLDKVNITSMISSLMNSSQIIDNTNGGGTNDLNNGLVTLFSAHIIPAGDVNKQKVLKICIPKDMLSFLLHLHNSTKTALEMTYQNLPPNSLANKTMNFQGVPFIRQFMEKMFMKSNISDLQVPIATAKELYEAQKISTEKIQNNQFYINKNYNHEQNLKNDAHQSQSDLQNVIKKQNFDIKDNFLGISEKTSSNYHLLHQNDVSGFNQNSFKNTERDSHSSNVFMNNYNADNSFSYSNSDGDSGGSFYSLQHPIYQYVKIPNQKKDHIHNFESSNETKNQSANINYSVKDYKSTSEHVLSTVQTSIQNSDYAESKSYKSSNSSFSKIHTTNIPYAGNGNNNMPSDTFSNVQIKNIQDFSTSFTVPTMSSSFVEKKFNSSFYHVRNDVPFDDQSQQKIAINQNVFQNNKKSYSHNNINQDQIMNDNRALYSDQDLSKNIQASQYSQYVNIPIDLNRNIEHANAHYENQRQSNSQSYIQSNVEQQDSYVSPAVYNANLQHHNDDNGYLSNNYKTSDQQHTGEYTTVEVVPALGFAIDSVHERQDYFNALSKGLQDVQRKYQAPYVHQKMYTSTYSENPYAHSTENMYENSGYNVNDGQNSNKQNQYPQYQNQPNYNGGHYETQNRLIHRQMIAHPQTPSSRQSSLPIEDLGYSHEKPNVPFTY